MSDDAATEEVAVNVTVVPEFSASDVVDVESVIDGVDSSSTIVNVTLCVPDSDALPPETAEIAVMKKIFRKQM